MILQGFYFTDLNHARAQMRAGFQGMYINIQRTIDDGFLDLYAMDNAHADRIAKKYKATKGKILRITNN